MADAEVLQRPTDDSSTSDPIGNLIAVWETTVRAAPTDRNGRFIENPLGEDGLDWRAHAVVAFVTSLNKWGRPVDFDAIPWGECEATREAIQIYEMAAVGDEAAIVERLRTLATTDLAASTWGLLKNDLPKFLLGVRDAPRAPTGWEGPYVRDIASVKDFDEWLRQSVYVIEVLGGTRDESLVGRSVRNAYRLIDKLDLIQQMPVPPLVVRDSQEEVAFLRGLRQHVFAARRKEVDGALASAPEPTACEASGEPFIGGELAMFEDRVELCGVCICKRQRSDQRWRLLKILSEKAPLDGKSLGNQLSITENAIAGVVRALRDEIVESLRSEAGTLCDRNSVILSGGRGYRLAETISVRNSCPSVQPSDQCQVIRLGTDGNGDFGSGDAGGTDRIGGNGGGGSDPGALSTDLNHDAVMTTDAPTRRSWIVAQLEKGRRLDVDQIVTELQCSPRTAQRDLAALREGGRITSLGPTRNRRYLLTSSKQ
jgi:hypothetical protein